MPPPSDDAPLFGAVEGGGTKFVCAVGGGPNDVHERVRIETRGPEETLGEVVAFFRRHRPRTVGVAMFGPLEMRPDAGARRGTTLRTPKPAWSDVPVRAHLEEALAAPVRVDTDVNAAALGEHRWGHAQGADPVVYVTVGTGVGGGVLVRGEPLHGLLHPELGHLPMPRAVGPDGTPDPFEGACPFHGRCLEGLASGAALRARLGGEPDALAGDDPVWHYEAQYIAHGLVAAVLIVSPGRIVLGGGVMSQPHLYERVRRGMGELLGGYLDRPELDEHIEGYVVAPAFEDAGLVGAFALAERAYRGVARGDPL